jgi:hypothetical protein
LPSLQNTGPPLSPKGLGQRLFIDAAQKLTWSASAPDPTPSATVCTHRMAMRWLCGAVRTVFGNVNTGRIESE